MIERLSFINIPYEFIKAVDHKDLEVIPYHMNTKNQYACLLSHIKALEAFKASGDSIGIIIEDDIVFTKDFKEKLDITLTQLPEEWWMFYLGFLPKEGRTEFKEGIYQMRSEEGAFGYIVKKELVDFLLNVHKELREPSDVNMTRFHGNRVYGIMPLMVMVEADYSDIQEEEVEWESIEQYFKE